MRHDDPRHNAPSPGHRLLVTGANTPLGERIVRQLLRTPGVEDVIGVGFEAEGPVISGEPRFVYRAVDLTSGRQAHELLFGLARDHQTQIVLHTAMHRGLHAQGGRVHAQNVEALRELLTLAERHPTLRRLVLRSYGEVYQIRNDLPTLITEDHPLNMSPKAPQWVRDRVEADLTACTRMGLCDELEIAVLRLGEILAPGTGSQLFDYLEAPICLRPAGYDPMMNLLSLDDAARALILGALAWGVQGVFNIPGADTLPLTEVIHRWGRVGLPVSSALLTPIYRLRRRLRGAEFSYGMNRRRFHYGAVLDGGRALTKLGYTPSQRVLWPTA